MLSGLLVLALDKGFLDLSLELNSFGRHAVSRGARKVMHLIHAVRLRGTKSYALPYLDWSLK
jgi:hypothetical protein